MNGMMLAMVAECVQCHRGTLTMVGHPVVICQDCLHDRQPMSYQVKLPPPLPSRWKTWPVGAAFICLYVWLLSWPVEDKPLFWVMGLLGNGTLFIRTSYRLRKRAARRRSELQSARNEALRKRIGGWDAA